MTERQRRLLFISYAFPPTGGGGVQRSVKFTKYLPEFGWLPTVLTAVNPSVPVQDADLPSDVRPTTKIVRARTWEPSYRFKQQVMNPAADQAGDRSLSPRKQAAKMIRHAGRSAAMSLLQPDPQVLWNPMAYRQAVHTLKQLRYDAIYATGPPFSSFLLARRIKRRFGLPLILDFRDEWLLASQYLDNYQRTRLGHRRQRAMLNRVLRAADAVIATTQASAGELSGYLSAVNPDATVDCIYNGFDPPDFENLTAVRSGSRCFRIVYTGTLWQLTDIGPCVQAIQRLTRTDPSAAKRVELILAGRRTPEQDALVSELESTPVKLQRLGYLSHEKSLQLASDADALLLLLSDHPGAERVVPAKLFEYLALRKPILGICGPGEATELLRTFGTAELFRPEQTNAIADWIACQVAESGQGRVATNHSTIEQFARRSLTAQLASLLDDTVH